MNIIRIPISKQFLVNCIKCNAHKWICYTLFTSAIFWESFWPLMKVGRHAFQNYGIFSYIVTFSFFDRFWALPLMTIKIMIFFFFCYPSYLMTTTTVNSWNNSFNSWVKVKPVQENFHSWNINSWKQVSTLEIIHSTLEINHISWQRNVNLISNILLPMEFFSWITNIFTKTCSFIFLNQCLQLSDLTMKERGKWRSALSIEDYMFTPRFSIKISKNASKRNILVKLYEINTLGFR